MNQNTSNITPVEISSEEAIERYLSDDKVQAKLAGAVDHLMQVTKGRWRDAEYIRRNSVYHTKEEVRGMMDLLILNKSAVSKFHNSRQSICYKITPTKADRKLVVESLINEHKNQIQILEAELAAF